VAERDAGAPFDLSRGPLLRATLVVLDDARHRLLLTARITRSPTAGARAARSTSWRPRIAHARREPSLPALPIQYADYADWQRDMLAGGEGERQLAYWRAALRDVPARSRCRPTASRPRRARSTARARVRAPA
jgi:hypothetical protein